jgi:5-dehydro-2-deoxygluconokinase
VRDRRPEYGVLCDGRLGADTLSAAEGSGLWIGRPVEWPGSRPLTLEPALGPDYGGLSEWPRDQVVKVLCFCHPDDDDDMWSAQEAVVQRLFHAAPRNRLEFLLEVIPSKVGLVEDGTTARIIQRFCDLGVYPGWLKLEPVKTEAAWRKSVEAIERSDPRARGIVVLGLDAPEDELAASFVLAHDLRRCGASLDEGENSDADAVAEMAQRFNRLCGIWDKARATAQEAVA